VRHSRGRLLDPSRHLGGLPADLELLLERLVELALLLLELGDHPLALCGRGPPLVGWWLLHGREAEAASLARRWRRCGAVVVVPPPVPLPQHRAAAPTAEQPIQVVVVIVNRGDGIDRRTNLLLRRGVVLLPTVFFSFLDLDGRRECRQLRLRRRVGLRQVVVGGSDAAAEGLDGGWCRGGGEGLELAEAGLEGGGERGVVGEVGGVELGDLLERHQVGGLRRDGVHGRQLPRPRVRHAAVGWGWGIKSRGWEPSPVCLVGMGSFDGILGLQKAFS
jgi:hypothetical protein